MLRHIFSSFFGAKFFNKFCVSCLNWLLPDHGYFQFLEAIGYIVLFGLYFFDVLDKSKSRVLFSIQFFLFSKGYYLNRNVDSSIQFAGDFEL